MGSPPPSPCSLRWEPGCGAGGETAQKSFSSGGSGPVPCSAASSGLWSLILGQEGGGSRVATATASSSPRPSPWPLGILLPGVSVSPERVPGILSISLAPGGPSPTLLQPGHPTTSCPGLQEGQGRRLSRKNGQSKAKSKASSLSRQARGRAQKACSQQDVLSLKKPSQVPTNPLVTC